jgi:hypothetical protein
LQAQSPEFKSQPPQKTKKRKRTMKGRMEREGHNPNRSLKINTTVHHLTKFLG